MEIIGNQPNRVGSLSSELGKIESSTQLGEPIPASWMGCTVAYPRKLSVVDFIREKAQLQPNAPAVEDGDRVISYGELDRRSDRIASELLKRGLRLEEPVAVMTLMSAEFLVCILGILKAGGCYFPLDTDTPAKRLEFLLADCGARFAWLDAASRERLKDWQGIVLDLPATLKFSPDAVEKIPMVPSDPRRLAYLLYTSGSTGQPKGVQIEHHSLTNFVCFYHRRFDLTPGDRSSMLAYIAFDVSVSDVWPVLCAGGTVVVPPAGILKDPDGLIHWLETWEITMSFVPTGLVEILFARPWPVQMKLRYLVTGGDRLRSRPPPGLPFTVVNGYGPTESTVFSTMAIVKPEEGSGKPPPIGCPLENVTAYVLDEKRQMLPVGAAGELYLGGEQLARGYLGRPGLTEECFVPDPYIGQPGARMYRTGDWARWLPEGELDFLGRKDDQIQIRGCRVELGEIEARLFAHKSVKQVCCLPRFIDGMPTGVVAHIVPNNHKDPSQELRDYLSAELPEYMVPGRFVLHERLPLTPQGKTDRAAMMALTTEDKEHSSGASVADGLRQALTRLWRSLLPAAANTPKDATFAELGGDSLLVIRLMLGVKEITGQQLEPSAFLVQPTLDGLDKAVKAQMAKAEFQPVLALRKHGHRPPLFFLYGLSGDIEIYLGLAEALGDDQPVYGIRSPALEDLSRLPDSMEAAAAEIVRSIRTIQPQGAPALVGYCWAGQLAFAVARQMAQTGGGHNFVAAIGSDAPRRRVNFGFSIIHFIRYFPVWLGTLLMDSENRRRRIMRLCRVTVENKPAAPENDVIPSDWASTPIARCFMSMGDSYCPLPATDIAVDIFRERNEYKPYAHPVRPWDTSYMLNGGWERWTSGEVKIHWLEGDHRTILKPPVVTTLAQAIRSAHDRYLQNNISKQA